MKSSSAILICDRDQLFRETLKNFLLATGYSHVEVAATTREALAMLRSKRFGCVMIGLSRSPSREQRLAAIARRRQPHAKIMVLFQAENQPRIKGEEFHYLIKEHVFSSLRDWLETENRE
jgi:DNA-binding NtrC family response regulator